MTEMNEGSFHYDQCLTAAAVLNISMRRLANLTHDHVEQ